VSRTAIDPGLHGDVAERLREAGQRYTSKRRRLVELLAREGSPLSLPQILRLRRDLPQSSVYRNLADLEQAGVVTRVATEEDHGRYELSEELLGHHHHVLCSRCGRTLDVTLPDDLESALGAALDRVGRASGFASVSHRLDLIGICEDCARSG
jgi:Fe2+ or Zn2+ uptake regulation protein